MGVNLGRGGLAVDIKIMVAAHKPYWMPEDSVYLPVHVARRIYPLTGNAMTWERIFLP